MIARRTRLLFMLAIRPSTQRFAKPSWREISKTNRGLRSQDSLEAFEESPGMIKTRDARFETLFLTGFTFFARALRPLSPLASSLTVKVINLGGALPVARAPRP